MYFFSMCFFSFLLYTAIMSSKYCSKCPYKLPISSFLKDALASPSSRVYSTCIQCRSQKNAYNSKKRAALQSLDPNIQPAKRVHRSNGPQPIVTGPQAPLPLNLPIELPPLPPNPPTEPRPQAPVTALPPTEPTGFLPTDEWRRIQDFNQAMAAVRMETCQRCQEHGFSMDLKEASATGASYGTRTARNGP
jgi:hypothetical protein